MGNFYVKIANNYVNDISYYDSKTKVTMTNNTNKHLNRYKQFLNHHGFYIVNINSRSSCKC